jgi:sugar phosphate isomerase/epimerase
MSFEDRIQSSIDRRKFLQGAGAGLAAGLLATSSPGAAQAPATPESITHATAMGPLSEKEKLDRIASNCWPFRYLFKLNSDVATEPAEVVRMKKKYGEITMLDVPTFTKETFPGVYQMDLISSFFGDGDDPSMFVSETVAGKGGPHTITEFDPSSKSGRKWLDKMANKQVTTGTRCHHISNDAPRDICEPDAERRKAGVEVAKKWLDGAAILGAKSMRVNTGGPTIAPPPGAEAGTFKSPPGAKAGLFSDVAGYPRNDALAQYLRNAIESYKEMADYGGRLGIKVTIENHWGVAANPINIRIIVEEVNSPFCEASPDFCNWEHEYLLFHGLQALAPYAHTHAHAKYWDRWPNPDVQRNVRIMLNANYMGVFGLEYEGGPWDGVEGAQYLYREVLAAL